MTEVPATKRLSDVLERLAANRVWAAAWTLFAAASWFAATFYLSAPEELTALDAGWTALATQEADSRAVERAYDSIARGFSAVADAARYWKDNVSGRSTGGPIPTDVVLGGTVRISTARRTVAGAVGTLDGITLSDPTLSTQAAQISKDLENADKYLLVLESFFDRYSRGDKGSALELVVRANSDVLAIERESAAVMEHTTGWNERAAALQHERLSTAKQLEARRRAFSLRLYATVPAIGYAAVFLVAAFRQLRRDDPASRTTAPSANRDTRQERRRKRRTRP